MVPVRDPAARVSWLPLPTPGSEPTHHSPPARPESASDDVAVMDCHDGNFLRDESDAIIPIDIIPLHPDAGLKQRLGILP